MRVQLPPSFFSETTNEIVREVAADAPSLLEIGLTTAAGIAGGGGVLAAGYGGYRLLKRLFTKDRTGNLEPLNGGDQQSGEDPFPRRLDEARQQRELAEYTERRCPEFDSAVGRITEDEWKIWQQNASEEERKAVGGFLGRVKDRADHLMPHSVREYMET